MMNNHFGISESSYQLIIATIRKFPEVDQAVIFGSRAKGNFKKGSDIDITIKGENVSPLLALDIAAILNEKKLFPTLLMSFHTRI